MPFLAATLALAAMGVLTACGGYPPSAAVPATPTSTAGAAGATVTSVAAGRDIFAANCNKCHEHPDVASQTAAEWPGEVEEMGDKAGLDAKQKQDVLHFVLAAREEKLKK